MSDRYQVKFKVKDQIIYGIYRDPKLSPRTPPAAPGMAIVDDAILPASYQVKETDLIDVPFGKNFGDDEYHKFVEAVFEQARKRAADLPEGLHAGKLFTTSVGDGCAYYVIAKVNKKTVKIEWRGFSADRWIDRQFGWGGDFPRHMIERLVKANDFWASLNKR